MKAVSKDPYYLKQTCNFKQFKKITIFVFYLLIQLPCMIAVGICLVALKLWLGVILYIRYAEKFGGFLKGGDTMWSIHDNSNKSVITSILFVQTRDSDKVYRDLKDRITEKIFHQPDLFPKLTSTVHRFGGYKYYLNKNYKIDTCLKTILLADEGKEITEGKLKIYIDQTIGTKLPHNDCALWEILVCSNPIDRIGKDNETAIIFRVNHTVGDGASLLKFLMGILKDQPSGNNEYISNPRIGLFEKSHNEFQNIIEKVLEIIYAIINFQEAFARQMEITRSKVTPIHDPSEYTNRLATAWFTEDSHIYIEKIRKIKRKVDCSFTDVIMVAAAAALRDHFACQNSFIPEELSIAAPVILHQDDFAYLRSDYLSEEEIKLHNSVSFLLLNIPLDMKTENSDLIGYLNEVSNKSNCVRKSPDMWVNYWVMRTFSYIPIRLSKFLFRLAKTDMLLTNIPGPNKFKIFNGYDLSDIVCLAPSCGFVGMCFTILSYDSRLQIGLTADNVYISEDDHAQKILHRVLDYITLLNKILE